MPTRVRIYVEASDVPQGTRAVLYGPDATGAVDYTRRERGGRTVALAPDEERTPRSAGHAVGPAEMGPAGEESRPIVLRSGPVVYGAKAYGIRFADRQTGVESDALEVAAFVSALPTAPRTMTPAAELVGGKVVFAISGGQVV